MMDINELLFLGTNKYGQAGIGEKHHNKTFTQPKSFAFPIFIKQISCGSHHSALLTIDGNVYTMGSNIHGALGSNPALNYSFSPTLVEGIRQVTKINCGPFHMCAISDGALYSWGKGIDGQLGHGNTKNMSKPTLVESLGHTVQEVSCGTNHTIVSVRDEEGRTSCFSFGNGIYGQLGTGQSRNSYAPVRVKLENIDSFAAGDNHSLFIVAGKVYGCGDNSTGQLGALFNKKFSSEPTKIQVQNDDPFVSVYAKKYSVALTQKGQMYVWGIKNGFGRPKKLKSSEHGSLEVIQARVANQKCYSLMNKGVLYQWNILKGQQFQDTWVCVAEKVVFNNRAILDFSVGEGYLLILGDIVKQIQYNTNTASNLSCYEDLESQQNSFRYDQFSLQREKQSNQIFQSQIVNQNLSRQSYEYIKPQSHQEDKTTKYPERKNSNEREVPKMMVESQGLKQRRDFNNIISHKDSVSKQEKSKTFTSSPVPQPISIDRRHIQPDPFDLMQSQSSSIQCEPTNFLKESIRIEPENIHEIINNDSILESSSEQIPYPQQFLKQKRHQFLEEKENLMTANFQKKGKNKKIDRVMEMLQKSHSISSKTIIENDLRSDDSESSLNESEIIKTNRMLRVDIREKELKISQLQELLSRKEMEIEAQREVIKLLRQKNNSNYASLEKP